MRPILRLLCLTVFALTVHGVAFAQFLHTVENGAATITGYTGAGGMIAIPAAIEALPVVRIGDRAFAGSSAITGVTLPGTVTSIGTGAFSGCRNLSSVTLPHGLTLIDAGAFAGCVQLSQINLPETLTILGSFAFFSSGLTSITIPASVSSIGASAFFACGNLESALIDSSSGVIGAGAFQLCPKLMHVFISEGTTVIGVSAFMQCRSLQYIGLPSSLIEIGNNAFGGCTSLEGIVIPEGVGKIGIGAFVLCRFSTVTLPASLTDLGARAFSGCFALTHLFVDDENQTYADVDGVLFDKALETLLVCPPSKAGTFIVPASVTTVAESAFQQCSKISGITLSPIVTHIGAHAFAASGITEIALSEAVAFVGDSAFAQITHLSAINVASGNAHYASEEGVLFNKTKTRLIVYPRAKTAVSYSAPSTVTSFASAAFQSAEFLSSVVIPPGVAVLPDSAFSFCTNLVTVSLPEGLIEIGAHAFDQCVNLSALAIPQSVTGIGERAFLGCQRLSSFVVPDGVRNLGDGVFSSCANLASVRLGAGVEGVDYEAFLGCQSLAAVHVDPANTSYSSTDGVLFNKPRDLLIFYPPAKIGDYTVPAGVTHIGKEAFYECTGLTRLRLPEGVVSIGDSAFVRCPQLLTLTLPSTVTQIGAQAFDNSFLTSVYLLGDSPSIGSSPDWSPYPTTLYYIDGRSGFTSPTWNGYPSASIGSPDPSTEWLLSHGFTPSTELTDDPNGDGVSLLAAYGLGLDPLENLSDDLPVAITTGTPAAPTLSMIFFAGNNDVSYEVQTSEDLHTWNTEGVTLSGPGETGFIAATVPMAGPRRFLRLLLTR